MKIVPVIISFLFSVVFVVAAARPERGAFRLEEIPRFDGYVGSADEMSFALSLLGHNGEPTGRLWCKLGQKIGRFQVVAFDVKKDELSLRSPDGTTINVRLVDSAVVESALSHPFTREAARTFAFELISSYLKATREEFPDRNVLVNPPIDRIPEEKRARFVEGKQKLQESGQFLTGFILEDGRWGQALSGDEVRKMPLYVRKNLSKEDRIEINQAWALARAEALARGINPSP